MKTEMEKCLAGEWYDCHNQVFLDLKTRTHKLLMKYNSLPYEDESGTNINDTSGEEAKNKNIVYQLLSFSCNHDESVFKGLNLTELFSDEMFL